MFENLKLFHNLARELFCEFCIHSYTLFLNEEEMLVDFSSASAM